MKFTGLAEPGEEERGSRHQVSVREDGWTVVLLLKGEADVSRGFVQGEDRRLRWGGDKNIRTEYPLEEAWARLAERSRGSSAGWRT